MAGKQDDILRARPSRQSYSFSVRKKVSFVKRFSTLRAKKLDAEALRGMVRTLFRKITAPKDSKADQEIAVKVTPYMNTFGSKLLTVFIMLVIVMALAIGFLYYMLSKVPTEAPPVPVNASPMVKLIPFASNTGLASYDKAGLYAAFSAVRVRGKDLSNVTVRLDLFKDRIPQKIFLLKSRRDQATTYEDFKRFLKSELRKRNFEVVEVHVEQLKRLPSNSSAILIVPSGFLPASFLGLDKDGFDIRSLTSKGFAVVYIGAGFNRGVESETDGRIPPDKLELSNLTQTFKIEFTGPTATTEGIQLLNPQYGIRGTEQVIVSTIHGSVSSLNFGDSGYVLFLPQTLDAGWSNPRIAADTVAKLIDETAWQKAFKIKDIASGMQAFKVSANGTIDQTDWIFSSPYEKRDSWGRLSVEAVAIDNSSLGETLFLPFPVTVRGNLRHESSTLPGGLGGQLLINSEFNEPSKEWVGREPVRIFLQVDDPVKTVSKTSLHEERLTPVSGYSIILPYDLIISSGNYIVRAVDEQGKVYAQSFLRASNIDIQPENINFGVGYFTFKATADGEPVKLRKVKIRVDGKDERVLDAADSDKLSSDPMALEYYLKRPFEEGNHTFEIEVAGNYVKITRTYALSKNWWDNPLYMGGFIITGLIFVVGFILKRPDLIYYGLDVPDFPPTAKQLIPLSRETMLNLFEQINKDYGWKFMPLSMKELKQGFRKIIYMGRGISIGDYNLERLMDSLRESGDVVEALGLYALKKWAGESGETVRHLALFRRLRDVCLNNAVRFTEFGERKDCDSLLSLGDGVFIHIYEGDKNISKILETAVKGRVAILFASDEEKKLFEKKLNATDSSIVSLKMLCNAGKIILATINEFEAKVFRKEKAS